MPLRIVRDQDYYLEISNDDDTHYIRIATFDNFNDAERAFKELTQNEPDMRVTMRRRAHVFGHYIPKRLRKPEDRRG